MNKINVQQVCNYLIQLEERVSKLENTKHSTLNDKISINVQPPMNMNSTKKTNSRKMTMTKRNTSKQGNKKTKKNMRKVGRFTVYDA